MMKVDADEHTPIDFLASQNKDIFGKTPLFMAYIQDLKNKGTYSYHRCLTSACRNRATIRDDETGEERELVVMASNNYLGLNQRPEVVAAAHEALEHYGSSLCGSRFLSGTYDLVVDLERRLADLEHREDAVVFTTGYQANVGTISALTRRRDVVFIDRLDHASIVDGCRMSGASFRSFHHNDMEHLERLLAGCEEEVRGKLIVVDGVFSMDGDLADLPGILEVARRHGARVMVDEAHGTGVVGPTGRGAAEHFGVEQEVDLILGTFSKTLVGTGGFLAGSAEVVNYVRHYGRSYMFSASPAPATVGSVLAALELMCNEPQLREELWSNIRYFHGRLKAAGLTLFPDPPESAVMTVPIGADVTVHRMSKDLYEAGLFTSSVIYPAVPRDQGRLRLSLSACHTQEDLDLAADILARAGRAHGLI